LKTWIKGGIIGVLIAVVMILSFKIAGYFAFSGVNIPLFSLDPITMIGVEIMGFPILMY